MRLINPTEILYNEALIVAIAGLIVNLVSVFILHQDEEHSDHNQKAAYLHVLADLLTSLAAIAGLLAAKYFKLVWVDPVVGLLGMVLILRWSWSLLNSTAKTLVDYRENKQTEISEKA
jgi:cation diffusion facilitator family transporter